jgi:hypothetical protein
MGRQVLCGLNLPDTAPGKGTSGTMPNPDLLNISHMSSRVSDSAILEVPTLLDFWMIWATLKAPSGCASLTVALPMVSLPGAV